MALLLQLAEISVRNPGCHLTRIIAVLQGS